MAMLNCRRAAAWIAVGALVLTGMLSTVAQAQAPALDPAAVKILKRMTDYMAGLQQFSVDTRNTLEAVLVTGEKIQFDSAAFAMVRRPNKLRAERTNDIVSQVFFYDGKTLTLYDPASRLYAAVAAAPPPPPPAPAPAAAGQQLPLGTVVNSLPPGCVSTPVGGIEYQYCAGNFYRAVFQGNNLVYATAKP